MTCHHITMTFFMKLLVRTIIQTLFGFHGNIRASIIVTRSSSPPPSDPAIKNTTVLLYLFQLITILTYHIYRSLYSIYPFQRYFFSKLILAFILIHINPAYIFITIRSYHTFCEQAYQVLDVFNVDVVVAFGS